MASVDRDTMIDGRYRVIKRLGSGGMADVYLVEDQQLGRRVALKLLYRHLAEDVQFVERFRREASSAAGLQHPNIVSIFDRGEWNGTYYIAMEYVEGHTLKEVIRERGPAPPEAASRHPPADPARRPLRAPARCRAPRHQAAERPDRRRRARPGHRLRDRPRRRLGHDRDGLDHGHGAVPLARAGAGPAGRRPLRPVLDRDHPLRAADRPRAVRRRVAGVGRAQAGVRGADPAARARPDDPAGARGRRPARAGEGPGAAVRRTPTSSSRRCTPPGCRPTRSWSKRRRRSRRSSRRTTARAAAGGCGC